MSYVPPNSSEAEAGVLGSLLLDSDNCLPIASDFGLTVDHFYSPANRYIFEAIYFLSKSGRPIDILTVSQALRDKGLLEKIGGQSAVEAIVAATPTSAHCEYYCKILTDKYISRTAQLIERESSEVLSTCKDPSAVVAETALALMRLSEGQSRGKKKEDARNEQLASWKAAMTGGTSGIPTPWVRINERFQGLQKGAVTLLAGRGGRGKSSMMATWGHFLGGIGVKLAWLPLEDGCRRTWARVAGIEGDFSTFELDIGKADSDTLELARESFDRVQTWPIFMEDKPMTVEQICLWATMQKTKHDIDVLFIDAFKDILRDDHDVLGDNRCSQQIVALAKRLDIPILVNNHVRKQGVDPRQTQTRITEQDIRGSGRIGDDARQIVILQNWVEGSIDRYEFDIIKNNYGPTGRYPLIRISNRAKWIEPLQIQKAPIRVPGPYSDE